MLATDAPSPAAIVPETTAALARPAVTADDDGGKRHSSARPQPLGTVATVAGSERRAKQVVWSSP